MSISSLAVYGAATLQLFRLLDDDITWSPCDHSVYTLAETCLQVAQPPIITAPAATVNNAASLEVTVYSADYGAWPAAEQGVIYVTVDGTDPSIAGGSRVWFDLHTPYVSSVYV